MKLALLGIDRTAKLAARVFGSAQQHDISIVCSNDNDVAEILQTNPTARLEPEWENLLLVRDFDLLLVAAPMENQPLRDEQLRRLVQEGVPTVVVQPAAEAILLHELAMIQHDTKSILGGLEPNLRTPGRRASAASSARCSGRRDFAGFVSAVVQRSEMAARDAGRSGRDAQWIRELIGPPDRVTALAPPLQGDELQNLVITFVGRTAAMAQWSLASASGEDEIRIDASNGNAVWKPARDGSCEISVHTNETQHQIDWTAAECEQELGRNLISFLEHTLEGTTDAASFDDATRAGGTGRGGTRKQSPQPHDSFALRTT